MNRVLALAVALMAGPGVAGPVAAGSLTVEYTPQEFRALRTARGTAPGVAEIRRATGGVRVVQAGRGHMAEVTTGAGNTAVVIQTGTDHQASVTQTGTGQGAVLIQTGTGGQADVVQQADGEKVIVVQHSWAPRR